MFIDRILYPVTALGPGKRIALWTVGCHRKCERCSNPELWNTYKEQEICPKQVADYINQICNRNLNDVDGITITGGEPFNQAGELVEVLKHLNRDIDVLVFTGYRLEDLQHDEEKKTLLEYVDVLIDGEYRYQLNDGTSALRGSINQEILFLKGKKSQEYEIYLNQGRQIQNVIYDYKTMSIGIHKE
ncbi:MAG: 4Fe-4S single cluster domain-containing protein [Anaerostipes sp.]|jgi:anaerobic ribonucleoside-triphosphate reductase activating protein